MKLKVWRQLLVQLKIIGRRKTQLKFVKFQIKNLNDVSFKFNKNKVDDILFISLHFYFYSFD
jgi:hypothetical protein